jgi:hypothetical protein
LWVFGGCNPGAHDMADWRELHTGGDERVRPKKRAARPSDRDAESREEKDSQPPPSHRRPPPEKGRKRWDVAPRSEHSPRQGASVGSVLDLFQDPDRS